MNAAHADLFNRCADGVQDPADEAALADLLATSPEARRDYVAFMWVHASLHRDYAGVVTGPFDGTSDGTSDGPDEAPRRGPPSAGWAAAILVAALAATALAFAVRLARPAAPLATVAKTRFLLAPEGRPLAVGQAVGPGRLEILGGAVELRLRNGVRIVLQGPGELDLVADMEAFLAAGSAVVRVPEGMNGFRLDTPTANVVDLGTEFAVRTGVGLATDVQVYDGAVIASTAASAGPGYPVRLEAGQARRFAGDADAAAEIPYDERRFIRSLPDPAIERSTESMAKVFGDTPPERLLGQPQSESIVVHAAAAPVVVDGRLDDWRAAPGFTAVVPGGGGAEWVDGRMMYDAERLYVAAHVGDPQPLRSVIDPDVDADRGWQGGSVQLRLSTDRRLGWPARGNAATYYRERHVAPTTADLEAAANPRLAHLTMWHHAPTGRACLTVAHGMDTARLDVNPPGFEGVFVADADGRGYVLEYAIPWRLVSAADDPPRSGDVLAAAWQVFWSDAQGQMWREQLVEIRNLAEPPRIWVWERAANWGRAEYR